PVSKHEDTPEIQLSACLDPQPFQPGAPPRQPRHLQAETLRRTGRVAGRHGVDKHTRCPLCDHRRQVAISLTPPDYGRVMKNPFRYFDSSPEVIRLVVMMYVRYPLSLRNVEDLL